MPLKPAEMSAKNFNSSVHQQTFIYRRGITTVLSTLLYCTVCNGHTTYIVLNAWSYIQYHQHTWDKAKMDMNTEHKDVKAIYTEQDTMKANTYVSTSVKEAKLELEEIADTYVDKEGHQTSAHSNDTHQNPSHDLHMHVGLGERGRERDRQTDREREREGGGGWRQSTGGKGINKKYLFIILARNILHPILCLHTIPIYIQRAWL